jgi:hypothetical protein
VARLQQRHLGRLRLLDLDDHVGLAEHRLGVRHDPRPLRRVVAVLDRRADARAALDHDVMAVLVQLADPRGRQRDAVLIGLDLGGNADLQSSPFVS